MTGICITTLTFSGWLAAPVSATLEQIDARQVAVNSDELEDGDDYIADLEMMLTNKNGKQRIRKVQMYRKDYGEDNKSVMFFLEPADVKNTGFLSWSYDAEGKDDEQWLYLPALKKVRRISSSGRADYFMGTDFTYSDLGDNDVDDYIYKHLEAEVIDGIECYHLERLPKDDDVIDETGYGRTEVWIRPDNWTMVKAVFYDKKLKLLKELSTNEIKEIDGIWTTMQMTMKNEQKNHTTILQFSNVSYNTGVDDDFFTERRLKRGVR
jgi:outer membrane lipoprotein-sorting protein